MILLSDRFARYGGQVSQANVDATPDGPEPPAFGL
jgi:hypothetical protein